MLALWHSHVPQDPCVLSASWSWARRSGAHSLGGPRGWGCGGGSLTAHRLPTREQE